MWWVPPAAFVLRPWWWQILAEQLLLASNQPADAPAADLAQSSLLLSLDAPSRLDFETKLRKTAVALYKFLQLGFRKLSANCRYIANWTDVMIQVCLIVGGLAVGGAANQSRQCSHVDRTPWLVVRLLPSFRSSAAHPIGDWLGRLHDRHVRRQHRVDADARPTTPHPTLGVVRPQERPPAKLAAE